MKAKEIRAHFQLIGTWVPWDRSEDQILFGDPDCVVKGIAIAWIATNSALVNAAQKGLNVFITHEPVYYPGYEGSPNAQKLISKKNSLLKELEITLIRCHDTWDRMPCFGIVDSWAALFGFETEPRPVESPYKICLLGDTLVEDIAQHVLECVKPLGQNTVLVFGNPHQKVSRMVVGTGAITHLPSMIELGADFILATDDGFNFWTGGLWSADNDIPLLIVNHSTSEFPGMKAMATYLKGIFPDIPIEYVDVAFPYKAIFN